jgi:uncharacterized protein (TIGR00269 family)
VKSRIRIEATRLGIDRSKKVLVAVSGGKDSFVLLDSLREFLDPDNIIPFNIEEGIEGYNRKDQADQLIQLTNVKSLIKTSFRESLGYALDQMVSGASSSGLKTSACTFCGGFRRKLINDFARKVGADVVVTGHNLDDEVQTIIINLLRGDLERLVRFGSVPLIVSSKFVPRLKPLRRIYEWETTLYANFRGYSFQDVECPYMLRRPTLRARVRELLYQMEFKSPGVLLRILDTFDQISMNMRSKLSSALSLPNCIICGEPTSTGRTICKNCELLIKSGLLDSPLKSTY